MNVRLAVAAAWLAAFGAALFLIAPLIVIAAASLSPTPVFDLPFAGASLRWYRRIPQLEGFWPALSLSVEIAFLATALAIGTFAAIAIARRRLPGSDVLATAMVSPLMTPGLVLGIALLQYFRAIGFNATWGTLLVAHILSACPMSPAR